MARERLRWTRTKGQRVVLSVNVFLVVVLGLGALGVGYATQKLGDVERLGVANVLTAAPNTTEFTAADVVVNTTAVAIPGQTTTSTEPAKPAPAIEENYLIVGSDNAERIAVGDPLLNEREEELTNHLADTIMLLRLRPSEGTASILSIPRDLEVQIAGSSRLGKINTAFNLPDAEQRVARLIDTIEENFDITLQHYVEVDLEGFKRVIDAVGGVRVCFDGPSLDTSTGLDIANGGWSLLDGTQARAFVRSRKLRVQNLDGVWENASPRADLDRIIRQQDFVRATVSQTLDEVVSDPRLLISMLNIASEELAVSNTFSVISDGADLASWFRSFTDENLETLTLDGSLVDLPVTAARNNEFRLGLVSSADEVFDVFRGIDVGDVVPKRVHITLGGTSTERGPIREGLMDLGFVIAAQTPTSSTGESTRILYGIGGSSAAELTAAFLGGPIEFVASDDIADNNIVVELGPLAVALDAPRALESAAPVVTVPTTTAITTGERTTTTTEPHNYEFDCSQSEDPTA